MLRRRSILLLPAFGLWPTVVGAMPDTQADPDPPFTIGTSTPGGGFALYGEMLERVLNGRAGRTLVRARPTNGTAENLRLLARGEIDAALIQGTAASEILDAPVDAPVEARGGNGADLRVLFAMYPSPGMLAVPAASSVFRLEDVLGRPVVFGVRTSGLVTLARQVFAGIGYDIDRDTQAIYVDEAAQSPRIVLAGSAVGLWGAGEGWPGFERLAHAPGGARFIGPAPDQVARIVAKYPSLKPMTVARDAYPGIDRPLATVGSLNLILARADLDVARASMFVRAMAAAASDLAAALPQAAFSTLANTRASLTSPALLHRAVVAQR